MEEQEKALKAAERGEIDPNTKNKLVQWMENIIYDYNSILEHKHLMKEGGVGHDYGGKMTASQSEEMTEELLRRI